MAHFQITSLKKLLGALLRDFYLVPCLKGELFNPEVHIHFTLLVRVIISTSERTARNLSVLKPLQGQTQVLVIVF